MSRTTTTHGFELLEDRPVPELNCNVKHYAHRATGARLVSIETDDINKVFGISFRTPVSESTGVAHILEHSVLCGSERFPVKKPFLELLRSSMHTFLNAFTAQDRTIYPVASLNPKSFQHLVDVYVDSVFHPKLTRETFEQEAWRHDLADPDTPVTYQGVVYNEMKGAQSSPHLALMRASRQSLFEDHPYVHDAGGVPEAILDLTWERLRAFHAEHYHPSNAFVFFYGDDDPAHRLKRMDEAFRPYAYRRPRTRVHPLPLTARHRRRELPFSPSEALQDRGFILCGWLMPEVTDIKERMLLQVLSSCLMGSMSAPLYKTLIDSGLGEEVIPGGFSFDLCQPTFSVGMEGVAPENFAAVEELIETELARLHREGFEDDLIESVLNTLEFRYREINNSQVPKGLALMMGMLPGAMYRRSGNSEHPGFREVLEAVKQAVHQSQRCLLDPIHSFMLANEHRSTVTLVPDPEHDARMKRREQTRLDAFERDLAPEERQTLADRTAWLRAYQAEPDSKEDLATIPVLKLADVTRETQEYPCRETRLGDVPYLSHDIFSHGIVYTNLLFDLHALPPRLLPYLDIFQDALRQTGTEEQDFVTFSRRISGKTGGIGVSDWLGHHHTSAEAAAYLMVSGKCLAHQMDDFTSLLGELLTGARLDHKPRIQQLLNQARSHAESGLIPAGHHLVGSRLAASHTEVDWVDELRGGVTGLRFLRQLCDSFEARWPDILAALEEIRALLLRSSNLLISVTSPERDQKPLKEKLPSALGRLPSAPVERHRWEIPAVPRREALLLPVPIQFVGRSFDLAACGYEYHGAASLATRLINTSWLWPKVREQGGAYGCSSRYSQFSGHLRFVSYRDPRIGETLATYDGTASFLRECVLDQDALDRLKIGTFGSLDRDLQPRAQGMAALTRHLTASTRELRQMRRDQIFEASAADVRRMADCLAQALPNARTVVMGSEDAIQEACDAFDLEFDARVAL